MKINKWTCLGTLGSQNTQVRCRKALRSAPSEIGAGGAGGLGPVSRKYYKGKKYLTDH